MQIITVSRILDDNEQECKPGDTVLLQTKDMDEMVQATIHSIMTNMATFIVDDKLMGYYPIKTRACDIISLTKYNH